MQISRKIKFDIYLYSLFFFIILVFAVNFSFFAHSNSPPFGNGIMPITNGMYFYNAWHNQSFSFSNFEIYFNRRYPPFVDLCFALYFLVFGLHTGKELLVNTAFFIITLISIYGVSSTLFNKKTALFAVAVFLTFYSIFKYSRWGFVEFALMGMVSLTTYCLIVTNNFSRRKHSIGFGLTLGLTALTKWSFLPYICGPLCIILASVVLAFFRKKGTRKILINFFLSIITALLICLPWYVCNTPKVAGRFHDDKINLSRIDFLLNQRNFSTFSDAFNFYLDSFTIGPDLYGGHMNASIFIIFLAVIAGYLITYIFKVVLYKKFYFPSLKSALILFSWIAIPCIILCLPLFAGIRNRSHLLPLLPAVAIIISAGLFAIQWKTVRYAVIAVAIIAALPSWNMNLLLPFRKVPSYEPITTSAVLCVGQCYRDNDTNLLWPAAQSRFPIHLKLIQVPAFTLQLAYYLPYTGEWSHQAILNLVTNDYGSKKSTPRVLLLGNDYVFRFYQFQYYNLRNGKHMEIIDPHHNYSLPAYPSLASICKGLSDSLFDYIILKPNAYFNKIPSEQVDIDIIISYIEKNKNEFNHKYKKIKQFTWPDSSPVIVYKRIKARHADKE